MGGKNTRAIERGKLAPAFSLQGTEGTPHSLRDALANGPLLLAFFKISCPTCQFTFPFIERIWRHLQANGTPASIWGVSQDGASHTRLFAREYGVTFPLLMDEEPYNTSLGYGVKYVPTLFLITQDGRVEITCAGFSKPDLTAIHHSLAELWSSKLPPLFQPSDVVPDFKPG